MTRDRLRIGFHGGIPESLGGAGLEIQRTATAEALRRRGHDVVEVTLASSRDSWDLLHLFGSEPDNWHAIRHWTRNRTPLVLSPVVVATPGPAEKLLRIQSRLPLPKTGPRMRYELLGAADALVALTDYERRLLRQINPHAAPARTIPNGAFFHEPATSRRADPGAALLLGGLSRRKRQIETIRALPPSRRVVVGGDIADDAGFESAWQSAINGRPLTWIRQVGDGAAFARLQSDALALIHMSRAEGQSLAVIETLSQGTPVILSNIPSHRELADQYGAWVAIANDFDEVEPLLRWFESRRPGSPTPAIPTWDDVAAQLESLYIETLTARHQRDS